MGDDNKFVNKDAFEVHMQSLNSTLVDIKDKFGVVDSLRGDIAESKETLARLDERTKTTNEVMGEFITKTNTNTTNIAQLKTSNSFFNKLYSVTIGAILTGFITMVLYFRSGK